MFKKKTNKPNQKRLQLPHSICVDICGSYMMHVLKFAVLFLTMLFSYRYDSNSGGEREIQRTMLELLNQLDGFDSRGDVKVIMATNRIETLDPALIRPGKRLPTVCVLSHSSWDLS